jgi:hypothetical protein
LEVQGHAIAVQKTVEMLPVPVLGVHGLTGALVASALYFQFHSQQRLQLQHPPLSHSQQQLQLQQPLLLPLPVQDLGAMALEVQGHAIAVQKTVEMLPVPVLGVHGLTGALVASAVYR